MGRQESGASGGDESADEEEDPGEKRAHHWRRTRLRWRGSKTGRGEIIDAPFNSSDGVFLPVLRRGRTRFERLERDAFEHDGRACDRF
jgi:hypothetical protein